jgi:hypothetical protein
VRILAFDPGISGGYAILDGFIVVTRGRMPIDKNLKNKKSTINLDEVGHLMVNNRPDVVVLERQAPRPGEGVSSAWTSGYNFGLLFATASAIVNNIVLVAPRTWATKLHDPESPTEDPKARSLEVAKKLFPLEDFLATERSSKPHEGIIDALLIAYWYNQYGQFIVEKEPKQKRQSKKKTKTSKKKGKADAKTRKEPLGV